MKLVWTVEAAESLVVIEEYRAQFDPVAAQLLVEHVVKRVDTLLDFPLSGPMVREYELWQIRQLVVEKKYRVLYRLASDKIEILSVWDSRRPLPKAQNDSDESSQS